MPEVSVGVVGLGKLGSLVTAGLTRADHPVSACYDIDLESATARLREQGLDAVPMVGSPRAVADQSDAVFVLVFDESQVRDVLFGEEGIAASDRRPLRVLLMSTVSTEFIYSTAAELTRRGIDLLDCGVNGAPGLGEGKTVLSVGGSPEAFMAVRPVLDLIAEPTVHMGPVGDGMKAKLLRNMIVYSTWYIGCLGTAAAGAAGLDQKKFLEVVDSSERWAHGATHLVHRAIARPRPHPSEPVVENSITVVAHKDLAAVVKLGTDHQLQMSIIEEIDKHYVSTQEPPGMSPTRRA